MNEYYNSLQLVPGLEESEYKREREFYEERGLPCPKDMEAETEKEAEEEQEEEEEEAGETGASQEHSQDYHRFDEQVSLSRRLIKTWLCHQFILSLIIRSICFWRVLTLKRCRI